MLVLDRLNGTAAAVDRHAVMRITPSGAGYRRRYAVLFALVGCPVVAGLIVVGAVPFAGTSLAIGQAWPMCVGAVLVLGVPSVDVIVSSRRIARAAPRGLGGASVSVEPADHVAGALAAWPPKSRSGSRLIKELTAACDAVAPLTVDFYARGHLVDFYGEFGFSTIDARIGLMRYSATRVSVTSG